jgi:hypothetical protein
VDAYGFIGGLSVGFGEFLEAVQEVADIRFASPVAGSSVGLVAAQVTSIEQLTSPLNEVLTAAGATSVRWSTTLGKLVVAGGTKPKAAMPTVGAVVAVHTPTPSATADKLHHRLARMNDPEQTKHGFHFGVTRTFGGSDLVVDVGAPDDLALADVLERLDRLGHGVTKDVSLAAFAAVGWWRD